jgi:hypothetical protein
MTGSRKSGTNLSASQPACHFAHAGDLLESTEASLARSLENSVQGIYARLDNMTQRLDSLITIANRGERH